MELFEQIRREYEYGEGTIKGLARKLGDSPSNGARSARGRHSARAKDQHARQAKVRTGEALHRSNPARSSRQDSPAIIDMA